jgi:N-acetylneuraminic acid mutarotase
MVFIGYIALMGRREGVKMKRLNCTKISNFVWILTALVLSGVLNITPMALAAREIWTKRADMPTPRWGLSTSVVNGKIYAIGGGQSPYGAYKSPVEEYDPATDTWARKADMPTGRAFFSTSVVNGKIYAIGGAPGDNSETSTVEEYDPATDTWARKADMPTARILLSTSVVNGKIYAIGGWREPDNLPVSAVEEYDPLTDTWTLKTDMPQARFALSTSALDGKIYAIGGVVTSQMGGPSVSTVEEYDPTTESWTPKTDMPTARSYLSTCVVNGKIYAIGGTPGSGGVLSTLEEYNPATDTWTTRPDMPTARCVPSASAVKGKIYTIGGTVVYFPWTPTSAVEVYEVEFIPADFNRDGIVNIEDLLILIENWYRNEPLVDIAPLPFGDGIVDVLDLKVLMSYWGLKVDDIIAHWALDETEGVFAQDSIGLNNGTLHGKPVWQPAGGKFAGALEFDGIDDYVETDFVLNPAAGSFSAFAWIKGGSRGQVIISQTDDTGQGTRWLWADPSYGRLMTRLMHPPFDPLVSESVITDGQWHHIGLVYDVIRLCRHLYVDGAQVAKDTDVVGGVDSNGGLYIGAAKTLDADSLFSGLIDDVRIYKRVLSPKEIVTLAR